ncbi:hypothetical protein HF325_005274 [Metschnikowia pulcherrima]|uniref:Uncharacterized protein n=1 Tax=Metschnikowia pulcherrima TaxID=27326 RepID=A0A8H7LAE3_9ASCO|nr:hypothetical protein HF325_005274 [Metschnikowia pulcherrima]
MGVYVEKPLVWKRACRDPLALALGFESRDAGQGSSMDSQTVCHATESKKEKIIKNNKAID